MCKEILLFLLVNAIFLNSIVCQEKIDGSKLNNVQIDFMDYKKSEFVSKYFTRIKESIAGSLSEYCKNNDTCKRDNNANYTVNDIGFYGTTEKEKIIEKGRFLIVKLYAKKDETEYLPKTVLKDIIVASRANIVKEGQVAIAYIDQTLVYPKRDDLDNIIIVSISCSFVVILVIFNIICLKKREKEIKDELFSKVKKSNIYNPDKSEPKQVAVKKRNNRKDSRELNANDEDADVQAFPIPEQTPMLTTMAKHQNMANTRASPHLKLTQV